VGLARKLKLSQHRFVHLDTAGVETETTCGGKSHSGHRSCCTCVPEKGVTHIWTGDVLC
jgi:hypothetical protein